MLTKLKGIAFWSVIAAAFIGPGTVTTCAMAGSSFGVSLLWALSFSVWATYTLQEAVARLSIASQKSFGEVVQLRYGQRAVKLNALLAVAVLLGCAAYEAGNIIGAKEGLQIVFSLESQVIVLLIGLTTLVLVLIRSLSILLRVVSLIVFVLGVCFIALGISQSPPLPALFQGAFLPRFPAQSALLITGLIGTTIVPYNLFLGSGIGRDQSIKEMRYGLLGAILIGGIISAAIVVAFSQSQLSFSFANAADWMEEQLGHWARLLFGWGLWGAGLTSAVTAPVAASIAFSSLLHWPERKALWIRLGVVGVGLTFALLSIKPILIILMAQVLNAFLLPFVTFQLIRCTNDPTYVSAEFKNSSYQTISLYGVLLVTALLGLNSLRNLIETYF